MFQAFGNRRDFEGALFAFQFLGGCREYGRGGGDQYAGAKGGQESFTQHARFLLSLTALSFEWLTEPQSCRSTVAAVRVSWRGFGMNFGGALGAVLSWG